MTVAISIVSGDGLVVAADSRSSGQVDDGLMRVLSDYAHKVFQVGECAVATYGWAFVGNRNIAGHMYDVMTATDSEDSPEKVADRIGTHFKEFNFRFVAIPYDGAVEICGTPRIIDHCRCQQTTGARFGHGHCILAIS